MGDGIKVLCRSSVSYPKTFLTCGLESRVVPLTFGTQRVYRFKADTVSDDGKSVIIRNSDIFGATGVFSFSETAMIYRTIVDMACSLEWAAELLAGTVTV